MVFRRRETVDPRVSLGTHMFASVVALTPVCKTQSLGTLPWTSHASCEQVHPELDYPPTGCWRGVGSFKLFFGDAQLPRFRLTVHLQPEGFLHAHVDTISGQQAVGGPPLQSRWLGPDACTARATYAILLRGLGCNANSLLRSSFDGAIPFWTGLSSELRRGDRGRSGHQHQER